MTREEAKDRWRVQNNAVGDSMFSVDKQPGRNAQSTGCDDVMGGEEGDTASAGGLLACGALCPRIRVGLRGPRRGNRELCGPPRSSPGSLPLSIVVSSLGSVWASCGPRRALSGFVWASAVLVGELLCLQQRIRVGLRGPRRCVLARVDCGVPLSITHYIITACGIHATPRLSVD